MSQTATHSSGEPELQDVEERKGPFTLGGQTFTVVAHNKRVSGKQGEFAQALASLDIADAAGAVLHHEEFPHAVENGEFRGDLLSECQTDLRKQRRGPAA